GRGMSSGVLIERFAQIRRVELELGDLTVLVGAQATGKSLVLQLLKLCVDHSPILGALNQRGVRPKDTRELLDRYLGPGMGHGWKERSHFAVGQHEFKFGKHISNAAGKVFYLPAHRTLAITGGWPRPWDDFPIDTPFVLRWFSTQLLSLSQRSA